MKGGTMFKVGEKVEVEGVKGVVLAMKDNVASVYVLDGAGAGQTKMIEVKGIRSMEQGAAEVKKSLAGMSDEELKQMLAGIRRERTGVTGRVKRGKVARNVANQASNRCDRESEERESGKECC
jgi:hypothetical protein